MESLFHFDVFKLASFVTKAWKKRQGGLLLLLIYADNVDLIMKEASVTLLLNRHYTLACMKSIENILSSQPSTIFFT